METGTVVRRGSEGFRAKEALDQANAMRKTRGVPRFMLKPGEEAIIVFVDDNPYFIWEHNLEIGGTWGHYVTCNKETGVCVVCNQGKKSTYVAYLTCIDTRKFVRKDGTIAQNRKVLYPGKGSTILRIEDLVKTHGGLVGKVFKVKRYTKDDPNCGTDFTYIKTVSLTGENSAPIEYSSVLALPTPEELKSLGFNPVIAGSQQPIITPPTAETTSELSDIF